MNRILIAALLLVGSTAALGANKATYSTAELKVAGKNNVADIVTEFLEDTDRDTRPEPDQLMFLFDGRSVTSLDGHLEDADRVEVMSDGTYVVINVVSAPESE